MKCCVKQMLLKF